jgi:Ca2+-binding EF-hand superfamily protein
MHIIGNPALFGAGQAQRLLGALLRPDTSSAGQSSPTGAEGSAVSTTSQKPQQTPGQRFASATLASLLSVQQQQDGPQGSGATDFATALIKQADTDGDGALSVDELKAALNQPSADPSEALKSMMSKLDANGDGKLDASELAAGLEQLHQAHGRGHHHHHGGEQGLSSTDLAGKLVGSADSDGDGLLSASEIGAQLSSAGVTMTDADLSSAIGKLDTDGDGKLSGAELAAAIDALRKAHEGTAGSTVQTAQTSATDSTTQTSATGDTTQTTTAAA